MSILDTVLSDTIGVPFRAVTGNVDPWTKAELVDDAAAASIAAGADPSTAAATADAAITSQLKSFTLGGSDRIGADPSQAGFSLPSSRALGDAFHADDGSGCGLGNIAGCFPEVPTWVYWAAGAAAIAGALWLLRPYVGLAASVHNG